QRSRRASRGGRTREPRTQAANVRRAACVRGSLAHPTPAEGRRATARVSQGTLRASLCSLCLCVQLFFRDLRRLAVALQSRTMMSKALVLATTVAVVAVATPQTCEWRDYAGGPDSSKFVALTEITKENV